MYTICLVLNREARGRLCASIYNTVRFRSNATTLGHSQTSISVLPITSRWHQISLSFIGSAPVPSHDKHALDTKTLEHLSCLLGVEKRPLLASKAVIFGLNFTGPHILAVKNWFNNYSHFIFVAPFYLPQRLLHE